MAKRKVDLVAEELALIKEWREQAAAEKCEHEGQEQCWRCGGWYAAAIEDDPLAGPDTCPHCGMPIVPF
jgi:hypothetical protein